MISHTELYFYSMWVDSAVIFTIKVSTSVHTQTVPVYYAHQINGSPNLHTQTWSNFVSQIGLTGNWTRTSNKTKNVLGNILNNLAYPAFRNYTVRRQCRKVINSSSDWCTVIVRITTLTPATRLALNILEHSSDFLSLSLCLSLFWNH